MAPAVTNRGGRKPRQAATAQSMARKQREISISEFFTKNRHLLGFDSPAKALLTTIKEAVDNALDACEEGGILPEILVEIRPLKAPTNGDGNGGEENGNGNGNGTSQKARSSLPGVREERFLIIIEDNGPGIVVKQIPRIFGKLLYGSKFHSLKQSRGQQGIGISAAGMYGQLTTGKPVLITSRTGAGEPANQIALRLDLKKNEPVVATQEEVEWEPEHGTRVEITLTGSYKRGQHSVDTYLRQTAIANPHVSLRYKSPRSDEVVYERACDQLPADAVEIKPHPYGVEMGLLGRMLAETKSRNITSFFREEFCRCGPKTITTLLETAGLPPRRHPKRVLQEEVQALIDAIAVTKIPNPPTNCLSPIGEDLVMAGLKQGVEADFYASVTRPPSVYRGNPFQVEVGVAYGGDLPADSLAEILRFANRVPLLYQASACAIHKAILSSRWRNYGLQQSRGAPPTGPLIILVHIASAWVPFTSESKEAVAHYPEIIKEIRLALQQAGRQLHRHVRRRARERDAARKQSYIEKYIPHIGDALKEILALSDEERGDIIETLTDTLERSRKM